jgi:predicted permease
MNLNFLAPAWRDLNYATRVLRKRPAFTITSVLTLALCIGANTAIFSVVDSVLLRPLPYPQPDALFDVITSLHGKGVDGEQDSQTGATWFAIRDNASDLDSAVLGGGMGVNLATHGKAQYVHQQRVSAGFFRVLGIHPLLGREISPDEDRPGGPPVAVLSYPLWQHAFAGGSSIVGASITLRGEPYTVVGVMPSGFQTNVATDVWTPLRPNTAGEGSGQNYEVIGRLKPGVSWAEAEAQIAVVGESALKQTYRAGIQAQLQLIPLKRGWTSDIRKPLLILWGTVAAVLLIGCVNIAGLLLARSSERTREIATRMAIGSGRAAVLRQLLAESVVLASIGGLAGIGLGYAGLRGLKWLAVSTFESWQDITLDPRVLAVAAGVSLLTSLLFGLIPALQASRIDIRSALSESGARGVAGGSHKLRGILVAGEVALGVMLLVGAGLLIRTFAYLQGLNPGFDGRNVITAKISLQDARYTTSEAVARLFDQSLQRIKQLPGVDSAAVGLALPYERGLNMGFRRLDGPHVDSRGAITDLGYITPEYFETLRIPLHRGRVFRIADNASSQQVAIVNEAFVRRYLSEQDPLGSHIMTNNIAREIVGVVGDVQQKPGWGPTSPIAAIAAVYVPAAQAPAGLFRMAHTWFSPSWIVRTTAPQQGVIAGMQRAMESIDPQLPFAGFRSMTDVQFRSLAFQRLQATLLSMLGGLALVLAAVGIYGLIASSVAERTRELGIRLALGATSGQAMRTIVAPGIALTLIGVVIGCALARVLVGVMQHIIFGVTPGDPVTFAAVAVILIAVAAVASVVPALRVLRLDPSQTLRHE